MFKLSLECTKQMLQMAEESTEAGIITMTMLDEQAEQLRHVEEGVDQIRQGIKQAQKNVNKLSKCCGLCLCSCNRLMSVDNDRCKKVWGKEERNGGVLSSQPTALQNGQDVSVGSAAPSGPYIKRITNYAREDEMENNLVQVDSITGNLKCMALDFRNEIDNHNEKIKNITDKTNNNDRMSTQKMGTCSVMYCEEVQ
ncbi:synaptosomal-associated protein 23-like [Myxocyprinus asiaticus]|uniref:synaptosomal-associated protein 23-like n=1 Tax=Myxocyprinus asiaticus TaxID=70543 RepID=UPI002222A6F9|nr:synaptosomal-associated protein 23-like [Myxocyprinus asiaticus]